MLLVNLFYLNSSMLIGASTGRNDVSNDEYERIRINPNHAFSVLAAHALDNDSARFVLMRDPHARSCYKDAHVTPDVLARLRTVHNAHRSTGAFWIEWTKFLRFVSKLTISTYVADHFDVRQQAKFTRSPTDPVSVFYFHVPQYVLAIDFLGGLSKIIMGESLGFQPRFRKKNSRTFSKHLLSESKKLLTLLSP
jgi:hypothetical protein